MAGNPFEAVADGVRIVVRLTPKSASDRVIGVADDAAGAAVLRVAVAAAPEKGKANKALIDLLAREWRVAKRDLTIVAGHGGRRKVVHLAGGPKTGVAKLNAWLADLGPVV